MEDERVHEVETRPLLSYLHHHHRPISCYDLIIVIGCTVQCMIGREIKPENRNFP